MVLVGFSGGAAFAGGLVLDDPTRYAGTAVLYGTVPFDAGVPTVPGRLEGAAVLVVHGENDDMIPADLLARTWSYLHDESGAVLTAHRDAAGHGLSEAGARVLHDWVAELLPA